MSISIDVIKYNFDELVNSLMKDEKINDKEMLEKILLEFGEKVENKYYILNNEYYEDGNCYYNVSTFIDKYFKTEDSYDRFPSGNYRFPTYREIEDVEENLNIQLSEEVTNE